MEYFVEDPNKLKERLRSRLENATDEDGNQLFPDQDLPGSPGYTLRELWQRMIQQHHQQINSMVEDFSPRTARGAALDQWAQFFNMPRTASSTASGAALIKAEVTGEAVERLSGTRRIPQGTTLRSGTTEIQTTEPAEIPENKKSVEVGVESVQQRTGTVAETGAAFDVQNRQLLTAEITASVTGGSNAEADDQLRYRLSLAMRAPSTFEGLEATLLSDPDVDEVQIDEAAYGPGTAEAFVSPAIAYPTEDLRQRLEAEASQGPGKVYVTFPSYEGLSLRIRVQSEPTAAAQRVAEQINNLGAGEQLIINDIEQAVRAAGAADAQVIGIKRGTVGDDRSLVQPRTLKQITNLQPRDSRTEWYARASWITICN